MCLKTWKKSCAAFLKPALGTTNHPWLMHKVSHKWNIHKGVQRAPIIPSHSQSYKLSSMWIHLAPEQRIHFSSQQLMIPGVQSTSVDEISDTGYRSINIGKLVISNPDELNKANVLQQYKALRRPEVPRRCCSWSMGSSWPAGGTRGRRLH